LEIEQLIEFYAVFGGAEEHIDLLFDETPIQAIERHILSRYAFFRDKIIPPALLRPENRRFLKALARSDGKPINIARRAAISRSRGEGIYHTLAGVGVLHKQISRETPPRLQSNGRRRKEERGYSVQDKVRFTLPFYRFWFTFIEPHANTLETGDFTPVFKALEEGFDRYVSFTFEELANALIKTRFASETSLLEDGSYWDRLNEFDLLARTADKRMIVGECKWKSHKICKSQLSKLKAKCARSGLQPHYFALFSRSGFSKELAQSQDPTLLCFELKDFERLLA